MVTKMTSFEDTPIQVILEVPNHESLVELLETVSDANLPVQTEDITPARPGEETTVTVDLSVLTDKQREALDLALEMGYYKRPRDATLTELAAKLNITKSAVSQRLRAAELKLVETAIGRYQ